MTDVTDVGIRAMLSALSRRCSVPDFIIHDLDPETMRQLHIRAADAGRSVEEEAVSILRSAVLADSSSNLHDRIRSHIEPLGGADLPVMARQPGREPPDFIEPMKNNDR